MSSVLSILAGSGLVDLRREATDRRLVTAYSLAHAVHLNLRTDEASQEVLSDPLEYLSEADQVSFKNTIQVLLRLKATFARSRVDGTPRTTIPTPEGRMK